MVMNLLCCIFDVEKVDVCGVYIECSCQSTWVYIQSPYNYLEKPYNLKVNDETINSRHLTRIFLYILACVCTEIFAEK